MLLVLQVEVVLLLLPPAPRRQLLHGRRGRLLLLLVVMVPATASSTPRALATGLGQAPPARQSHHNHIDKRMLNKGPNINNKTNH